MNDLDINVISVENNVAKNVENVIIAPIQKKMEPVGLFHFGYNQNFNNQRVQTHNLYHSMKDGNEMKKQTTHSNIS